MLHSKCEAANLKSNIQHISTFGKPAVENVGADLRNLAVVKPIHTCLYLCISVSTDAIRILAFYIVCTHTFTASVCMCTYICIHMHVFLYVYKVGTCTYIHIYACQYLEHNCMPLSLQSVKKFVRDAGDQRGDGINH